MDASGLTRCRVVQPSLATLLAKPNKGMHDSIFASNSGQTRKLHSYFPDPTMDIDNKVHLRSESADALPYCVHGGEHDALLPTMPGRMCMLCYSTKWMSYLLIVASQGHCCC